MRLVCAVLAGGMFVVNSAAANDAGLDPDAGDLDAGVNASGVPGASATPQLKGASSDGCTERIPAGKERPKLTEKIAGRAQSGHALWLEVSVEHGKGETVLPTGFHALADSPEAKALEREGFVLPDPEGGAGPRIERREQGDRATTTVRISFVPLPDKPGRHELVLPPLPIALSRASGELVTVCTAPHSVTVEDPIANTPNATPKRNPLARRQLEVWTSAKYVALATAIALVVGALLAWLIGKWLKRPKVVPPPPPPRPPWELAREALYDIRHAGLTKEGRFAEHFDRVSDVIRRYLGDRYGYDGLESTTREALTELRLVTPQIPVLDNTETFLRDADLVKFARLTPTEPECLDLLTRAEDIVERTVPAPISAPSPATAAPPGPSAPPGPVSGSVPPFAPPSGFEPPPAPPSGPAVPPAPAPPSGSNGGTP